MNSSKIEIFKGNSITLSFTVQQINAGVYSALDLTNATVKFYVKEDYSDSTYTLNKTCTITDATGGKCEVDLSTTDTALTAENYVAELSYQYSGTVYTLAIFDFIIKSTVK